MEVHCLSLLHPFLYKQTCILGCLRAGWAMHTGLATRRECVCVHVYVCLRACVSVVCICHHSKCYPSWPWSGDPPRGKVMFLFDARLGLESLPWCSAWHWNCICFSLVRFRGPQKGDRPCVCDLGRRSNWLPTWNTTMFLSAWRWLYSSFSLLPAFHSVSTSDLLLPLSYFS